MKKHILIILSAYLAGCASVTEEKLVRVKYSTEIIGLEGSFEKKSFSLYIPKNYKEDNDNHSIEYKEYAYIYDDGACIYITDDIFGGSALNGNNKIAQGLVSLQRKTINDSVYMGGEQKNGRF